MAILIRKAKRMIYQIWKVDKFNDKILTDHIADFFDLTYAKEFAYLEASTGETFAVLKNGIRIALFDD